MQIAIDTGGTFTDCVYVRNGRIEVLKLFSTPANPAVAVLDAVRTIAPGEQAVLRHGTTVGTNALLERKGARVAFVTTRGFEDSIAIGRQARSELYNWFMRAPHGLVDAGMRFGVDERTSSEGLVLRATAESEVQSVAAEIANSGAESIALSFLFSFANPQNEVAALAVLKHLGLPVSVSHRILPEFREYERASTVVVNAYLAPKMQGYLEELECSAAKQFPGSTVQVMQSSGGIVPGGVAAAEPVRTVLSGPAGGVMGAYRVASMAGYEKLIGFDMGGTSMDVCLVDGTAGGPRISSEAVVSGLPIAVPMLDIHTVGAGGGSLARFDAGGMLLVGPESAGADPGPACFGRGTRPTVTDANLLLGRLDSDRFLGGAVRLDVARARAALERERGALPTVDAFARGIVRVAEAAMEKAIRIISVERGHDPRDFTLVAFGGGGPLHACALARALRISRVLVPRLPGALSALGILLSDSVRDYSRTVMRPSPAQAAEDALEGEFAELEARARENASHDGARQYRLERSIDLRYRGQGYELNVPFGRSMADDFHRLHAARYGFADQERAVEAVNVRLRVISPGEKVEVARDTEVEGDGTQARIAEREVIFEDGPRMTAIYERERLRPGDRFSGPAIVAEYSSTTVVPPGDSLRVDAFGNLIIAVQ